MTNEQLLSTIRETVVRTLTEKGLPSQDVTRETVLLGSSLGIDSLDLAAIVVELTEATEKDPFQHGFIEFRTVGELIDLYSSDNSSHGG